MMFALGSLAVLLASCGSPPRTNPTSHVYPALILTRAERRQDVALKSARVLEFLRRENLSGVLIGRKSNFSWVTAGAEGSVPLFLRDDGRKFFIARTGDAPSSLLMDLTDMGYEAKTLTWYSGAAGEREMASAIQELSGGRLYATDLACTGAKTVDREIASLRAPLTDGEVREYRWLGASTAETVEDVCRRIRPGMTDRDIGILLSDALLRRAIRPVEVHVAADVPVTGDDGKSRNDVSKVERQASVSVRAECWGLRVAMTRIVHLGPLSKEAREQLAAAARVNAGFWARTLPGESAGSILKGAIADYAEAGYSQEWPKHHPGGAIGYEDVDWQSDPNSTEVVRPPQAFAWKAAIGVLRVEDTILVEGERRMEVLTETPEWPRVESKYLGKIYRSPGILLR